MTQPRYHVAKNPHGWSVVRSEHEGWTQPPTWLSLKPVEQRRHHHLGLAETLSEAVLIAQEDAGDKRALSWSWGDDFTHGEGQ